MTRVVPDTSIIIHQQVSRIVMQEFDEDVEVIIPEAVPSEIENHANKRKESGYLGLEELKRLRQLADSGEIKLSYSGRRPTLEEISLARGGEIDAMIRDVARENNAVLLTSDRLQKEIAESQGVETYFYEVQPEYEEDEPIKLERYFGENISSVHLKEDTTPLAKRGVPGHVELIELDNIPLNYQELDEIALEVTQRAQMDHGSFVEINKNGAKVIQYKDLRITIAKPPFSEGLEITAIKPVNKLNLSDYNISEKLETRLSDNAKGILVAGSPGAGKSTFAQALAEYYYYDLGQMVKTMESPRDLNLDANITQYAPLEGSMEKTADILLLVRPDYTIYDEVRKTDDFEIYSDMRLAGVGMIGIVHATKPIDAVQRFLGRLELGIIPSVIDTAIYINNGEVDAVYTIELTVKVPTGMIEADLSRPVIEIKDLETEEILYEIYTYGEQTIVIDVNKTNVQESTEEESKTAVAKIVEEKIQNEIDKIVPNAITEISLISDNKALLKVEPEQVGVIIGKNGKTISKIEENIGIHIEVDELELVEIDNKKIVESSVSGNYLLIHFNKEDIGSSYDILIDDDYVFTATVGKKAVIKLKQNVDTAITLMDGLKRNKQIYARLREENLY